MKPNSVFFSLRLSLWVFLLPGLVFLTHNKLHAQGQTLTVIIKNIKDDKGNVGAALYNSDKDFMKNIYKAKSTKAKPGEVQLIFENVPAGTYAISVMHDANENGKMDSNFVGVPKEGFGFSNDVVGSFGPPGFEEAKFNLAGKDQTITITLKYY